MIFRESIRFNARYTFMFEYLSKKNNIDNPNGLNMFRNYLELFLVGVALGIHQNQLNDLTRPRKGKTIDETTSPVTIFFESISKKESVINYLYTIAMLNYTGSPEHPISENERIERAFRVPNETAETEEEINRLKECTNIFIRYGLGGIEYMYHYFINEIGENPTTATLEGLPLVMQTFIQDNLDVSPEEMIKLK